MSRVARLTCPVRRAGCVSLSDLIPGAPMARWTPDPTFYPTAMDAMQAPPEKLAYVVLLGTDGVTRDALGVVDTDRSSPSYGEVVERVDFPNAGNELHHLGWNACSSHLCPWATNAHAERRYLIV